MDFCKDFLVNGGSFKQQIMDLLYKDLFNMPSNGCLEEWYDLMTNNANNSNQTWNGNTPNHGVINIDKQKQDVLFECDKKLFASSSIIPLFAYLCLGHDTPVWLSKDGNIEKMIRVMMIFQDPLRNRGLDGKILLSSPFGTHSYDYRNKTNEALMKILQGLWNSKDIIFYLTDFNKLYIKDETPSIETLNKKHPEIAQNFRPILDAEIELFKPDLIVTLADYTSNNLLEAKIDANNRFKKHSYNGIDVLPMFHIAGSFVSIARKKKFDEVNVNGKYTSWIDWYIDEILQCL